MEKISKIIPPSRRTQYMDLAKRKIATEQSAGGNEEIFQKPAGRVSTLNAKRIDTLLASEKLKPQVDRSNVADEAPANDVAAAPINERQFDFNRSADAAPEILENMVVDKTSSPIDRVSIANAKNTAQFVQGAPYEKKASPNATNANEAKTVTDAKATGYESMREAKQLQAAKNIARKFQNVQENVNEKKEIRGTKPQSEVVAERVERSSETTARAT